MKDINHYTTLSEEAAKHIEGLDIKDKLQLMCSLAGKQTKTPNMLLPVLPTDIKTEIQALNQNQELGLMKALCDQCQLSILSK